MLRNIPAGRLLGLFKWDCGIVNEMLFSSVITEYGTGMFLLVPGMEVSAWRFAGAAGHSHIDSALFKPRPVWFNPHRPKGVCLLQFVLYR